MKVAATCLFLLCAAAYGQPKLIVDAPPVPWLTVTGAEDPKFLSMVEAAIGGDVAAQLGAVLPYSVLIANHGTAAITNLSLIFRADGLPGTKPRVKQFAFDSFNQPPILSPGQSQLFTPSVEATRLAALRTVEDPGPVDPRFTGAARLTIRIDLVIAADGRTAGPDSIGTVQRMRAEQTAYEDISKDIGTRIQNGDSAASLQARLEQLASQQVVFSDTDRTTARYTAQQVMTAQHWIGELQRGGPRQLRAALQAFPPEKLHPGVRALKEGALR